MITIAASAAMLSGCSDDENVYPDEYASVVRLDSYGEQKVALWSTDEQASYEVRVLRGGHDIGSATDARLKVMSADEWSAYAESYGLQDYHRLPADCFNFDATPGVTEVNMDFAAGQHWTKTVMSVFSDKVGAYVATLPATSQDNVLCVPLALESTGSSVFADRKALVLVIDYRQPSLELSRTGFTKVFCTSSQTPYVREYTLALPGDNNWGFTVKVRNDQSLLDSYNAANETHYTLMQPGALEINTGDAWTDWADHTFDFPVGTTSVSFKVRINPAKVGMMDAMALSVTDASIALKLDADDTTDIFAIAVKPSGVRLKPTATHSDYDGTNGAKNLVDGRPNTYFQSQMTAHDGDPVYGSYIDFKLPKDIRYFVLDYQSRASGYTKAGVPDEVHIYVSADGTNWTLNGKIRNMQNDFTGAGQTVSYGNYDAGQPIRYIRWAVVMGGDGGAEDLRARNTTANWTATGLNIYGK